MTEEKLREKIALRLWDFSTLDSEDKLVEETKYVDQILTLIREAGYRSPEEVNQRIDIILGLGEKKEPQ